jgi:hypothetical protein
MMFEYRLDHVFSYVVTLKSPPEVIGPVPGGIRTNFYVVDGEISGPRLRGRVRPVGGDWFTVRTDGVGILDVRATFESHDGALIEIAFTGIGDLGEDGYQKFLRQELTRSLQLRVAPRFRTAHPDYEWLNRVQCIGVGEINMEPLEVRFDIYAMC